MKKIIFIPLLVAAVLFGSLAIYAEETDVVIDTEAMVDTEAVVETEAVADTEAVVDTDLAVDSEEVVETESVADTEAVVDTEPTTDIDFEEYAEKFVDYIFSGASGSSELMDKIIAIGEQYQEAKEQGYTFKERLAQLITPDNLMVTMAAAFLFVIGIAFFIFRHSQNKTSRNTAYEINSLKKMYAEEVETNKELRDTVIIQSATINELKNTVGCLSEKSDITKTDMEHVNKLAMATATMVKDVFMNSKTIDSSGKNLLLHDYMQALDESEKFGAEEKKNADQ
jgi:hypothetical protein